MLTPSKAVGYFLQLVAVVFFIAAATYYGDYGKDRIVEAFLTGGIGFVLLVWGGKEARGKGS